MAALALQPRLIALQLQVARNGDEILLVEIGNANELCPDQLTTDTIGTIWQIFANSEYGFGRFEVTGPAVLPPQQRFRLELRLLRWHWRVAGVILPQNIQDVLVDELIKARRK